MEVTKEFLKELKAAESISIRRDRNGNGCITLWFEDEIRGKRVRTDKSWLCQVTLRSYQARDYESGRVYFEADKQDSVCYHNVSLYWNQGIHACSILSTLKVGDDISFEFVGNAGNVHTFAAGLHEDNLNIRIKSKNRTREFQLDNSVNPGNTARMINGGCRDFTINRFDTRYENRELNPEAVS